MSKSAPKMQPWQVFHAARVQLGPETVARIFNRSARAVYDWAQDPANTSVRCKSPLEPLHTLFGRLEEQGRGYVARAALDWLATALEDGGGPPAPVVEPARNIETELLRDFGAVADLKAAIDAGLPAWNVANMAHAAKDEIDRTLARYLMERRKAKGTEEEA